MPKRKRRRKPSAREIRDRELREQVARRTIRPVSDQLNLVEEFLKGARGEPVSPDARAKAEEMLGNMRAEAAKDGRSD